MSRPTASCPVCGSVSTTPVLDRGQVPVHQNRPLADAQAAVAAPRGRLEICLCASCGYLFNRGFDASLLAYDADYENTQTCSPLFDAHVAERARHLIEERDVRNCRIVEVGCGKGHFLRRLVESEAAQNVGYGFDTTYAGPVSDCAGRLHFVADRFGPEQVKTEADVVVCRHVIEHVPDPVQFLGSIRAALRRRPQARLFFETPCVEWILSNRVVWDFYYEHCGYFSTGSLATAFERAGLQVVSVQHVFAGQYLWLEAAVPGAPVAVGWRPGAVPQLAGEFARAERERTAALRQQVERLAVAGRVALWGAGAKGVTYAGLVDPGRRRIACVVDVNPQKQGRFVPGTGHPIVHPGHLAALGKVTAILMNPNYRAENQALLADARIDCDLVDPQEESGR